MRFFTFFTFIVALSLSNFPASINECVFCEIVLTTVISVSWFFNNIVNMSFT